MKQFSFKHIILLLALSSALFSCENQDWEFDNFEYTTAYFPWQYPVRTIVLGEVNYDNTNDLNHRFVISTGMGGVFNNEANRVVRYEIVPSLLDNLLFEDNRQVMMLPDNYYTLSDESQMVIPNGKESGGVTVQLTDAFFEDELSYTTTYVLPMKIVTAEVDSVLRGKAKTSVANPDSRVASDWDVQPKDFTIFGVKYINEYHGNYLLRGKTTVKDNITQTETDVIYRNEFVERDIVTLMQTRGLHKLHYTRPMASVNGSSPGNYVAIITIDEEGNCNIKEEAESAFTLTGTGKYVPKGDAWGGENRNVFHLDMSITHENNTYSVKDTLVFRDNTVSLEEFSPKVNK